MGKKIYILITLFTIFSSCNKPLTNEIISKTEPTTLPSIILQNPSTQATPNPESSSIIFPKVEELKTIPENPCIGDSVTIKGINFQDADKVILFMNAIEPAPSPSSDPLTGSSDKSALFLPNASTSIKLGTTTIDNDGLFKIPFELKEKIGPIANGNYKIIEKNKEYYFYIHYGNNLETGGAYKFFSIKTCLK